MRTNLAERIQSVRGQNHPKPHRAGEVKARARRPLRKSASPKGQALQAGPGRPATGAKHRPKSFASIEVPEPVPAEASVFEAPDEDLTLPPGAVWEGELPFSLADEAAELPLELPVEPLDEQRPSRRATDTLEPATTLTAYFRDLSHHGILTAAQELVAVKEIEELEIALWECILSYGPSLGPVLDLVESAPEGVEASLGSLRADFKALRRLGELEAGAAGKARQAKLTRQVAEALRALDADRRYSELVLEYLHGAAAGGDAPFKAKNRAFAAYLYRIDQAMHAATAARARFIQANLRLVVAIARRYRRDLLPFSDLIQEGNIGLMKGLARFNHRRGVKFSTYASWWIRHSINRALADKGRGVRLPVHLIDARSRIAKAEHVLDGQLGHQPSTEEISAATKIPVDKIEKVRIYARDRSVSFDRPLVSEDDRDLLEIFQDHSSEQPGAAEMLADNEMNHEVMKLMKDVLKPIEVSILRWRFGFEDDRAFTLREIGDKYDLSRERIRQIEGQALAKLRAEMERREMA
jgi:RNA polymerase primary sigma factor